MQPLVRVRQSGGTSVSGWWPFANTQLTVQTDGGASFNPWTGGDGYYLGGFSTVIADGSTITVTDGTITQVVYVSPLTDAQVYPQGDTVSGVFADLPNTPLFVSVGGAEKQVTTDGSGAFTADFSGEFDITADDTAQIDRKSVV